MCGRSYILSYFVPEPGPGRREGQFRSGFRLSGCYRRGVLSRALRPGIAALAAAGLAATGCSGSNQPPEVGPSGPSSTVVTSTTMIASAGVLGNQRRPDESCAAEPARLDGPPPGPVDHAAGKADVVADPMRIVVLAGDELDALCALGLQSRIVAAALPDGSDSQPWYLGTVIHDVPAAGTRTEPDLAAIAAAEPDLILGSKALTPGKHLSNKPGV